MAQLRAVTGSFPQHVIDINCAQLRNDIATLAHPGSTNARPRYDESETAGSIRFSTQLHTTNFDSAGAR